LAVLGYLQDMANSACGIHDGYLHPQFASEAPRGEQPTGAAVDPYDRSRNPDPEPVEECGTVTRT
jgi:hypothetical protein